MADKKERSIHERMLAASQRVEKLYKLKPKELPYKVVLYDDVVDKANAALAAEGVYWFPRLIERPEWDGKNIRIELYVDFIDVETGEGVSVPGFGLGMDNQDKAPGKAYTYAVKSALLKALHMQAGDEDPDLHNGKGEEKAAAKPKPAPKTEKSLEHRILDAFDHFKLTPIQRDHVIMWTTGEVNLNDLTDDRKAELLEKCEAWWKNRAKLDDLLAKMPKETASV